jgi:N-methylhydantoinase B
MMSRDLVTIQIIKNVLSSIAKEMFYTTIRSAKSSIIYETYDFSPALLDSEGRLIAIGTGLPVFIGILPIMSRNLMKLIEEQGSKMSPGDIYLVNDPYIAGTHLNDVGLVMPLFYGEKLMAIGAIRGHVNDVGGMNPGSWGPNATEIYQEGLIIPGVRLYKGGELNVDVLRLVLRNSRIPDYVHGDIEALAAALRYAQRRIIDICDKYGADTVREAMEDKLNEGKVLARKNIQKLPKGEYFAEEHIEKYEGMDEDIRITVRVKITEDKFIADFSENPPQVRAPINTTFPGTYASTTIAFVAVTDPHVSVSEGYFDPVKVIAPEGTIFNAVPPAATSCYWETMFYAVDLIWKALAPHIPERLTAGHFLSVVAETISMIDPRDKKYKILVEPNPGGWGAAIDRDGESCLVASADGETYAHPAEVIEREYPIRVECMRLNLEDGVGHGRFRGGFGLRKDYRILAEGAELVCSINRISYPPWAVDGGLEGSCNHIVVLRDEKPIWDGGRAFNMRLLKGDIVSIRSGGGGGWGSPLERDPKLVQLDAKNRYISLELAREVYGVVLDPVTLEINWTATEELRRRMREARK